MQFKREKSSFERQALQFNGLVVLIIKEVASIRHGVTGLNVFEEQKAVKGRLTYRATVREESGLLESSICSDSSTFLEAWMNLQMKYASEGAYGKGGKKRKMKNSS